MKVLVVLSVVLAVTLAAPANVYSPYLLQDLAYQSVDADEDGQPDTAVTVNHPVAYPYAPYSFFPYAAPTVAVAAKSDEKAEVKTVPLAAPYGFAPYGFHYAAPYAAAPTFGYSFVTNA